MMGGGGSMQSMQTTIKNNRNLLPGRRKGFFKRELSYAEIRKYYKESTEPIKDNNELDKERLKKIKERIVKSQRRSNLILGILITVVSVLVSTGVYKIVTSPIADDTKKVEKVRAAKRMKEEADYMENMALGKQKMKANEYFMASGYFKRALKQKPNDFQAEYNLAEAYLTLCKEKGQACEQAKRWTDSLEKKYPRQVRFTNLH